MTNEFKGRYAYYCEGDNASGVTTKKNRVSLNQIKIIGGTYLARGILTDKQYVIGNTHWYELELLPGELSAADTLKEKKRKELCQALYMDLRQSYPSITPAVVITEVDKLVAGGKPEGIIQMFAHKYLVELGLIKEQEVSK